MNIITIIAILLISTLFTITFAVVLKSRGPWGSAWSFFIINVLWLVAVSLWIPPAGPVWYGAPWIDLFVTGLLLSFLLSATPRASKVSTDDVYDDINAGDKTNSAVSPHRTRTSVRVSLFNRKEEKNSQNSGMQSHFVAALPRMISAGGIFWMLLLCLCALIIIGAI
jgi:hypothetical protein